MKIVNVDFKDDIDIASGIDPRESRDAEFSITLSFGLDNYELEVCKENYGKLRDQFLSMVAAGHKVDSAHFDFPCISGPEDPRERVRAKKAADRARRDEIRAWAAGHPEWSQKYNGKGRIPAALERDYEDAH